MADDIEKRVNKNGEPLREVTRRTIDLVANILRRAKRERIIEQNPIDDLKALYPKVKSQHMKHVMTHGIA